MEILKQLYETYSPSGHENRMRRFIKRWARKHTPTAIIEYDSSGNIYITKGQSTSYPCIVSHMDQVQRTHSKDFKAIETEEIIFGFSLSNKRQEGPGCDDKNGIWCCLKCLERYDICKAAFFVMEEVGCVGSTNANMDFFKDCRFVLQADRRGANDLITTIFDDTCSPEFVSAINPEQYGYSPTHGLATDIGALKENGLEVSAINISCGYYNPHTDHEFTIKAELINCLHLIFHIFETCTETYPHIGYGWGTLTSYNPYHDTDYEEAADMVYNYVSYYPDASPDMVYEECHGLFPTLTRTDFERIFEEVATLTEDTP